VSVEGEFNGWEADVDEDLEDAEVEPDLF